MERDNNQSPLTNSIDSQTCKWLATFSLVNPGTFINSRILFGTASAIKSGKLIKTTIEMQSYDFRHPNFSNKSTSFSYITIRSFLAKMMILPLLL